MHALSSGTAAAATRADREATLQEYFKSREVYRGARGGAILVDAFRFVSHAVPFASSAVHAGPPPPQQQQQTAPTCLDCKGARHAAAVKLEDTSVVMAASRASCGHNFYFLSHFHSDHYTGITHRWHDNVIYCSRPTATLTCSQLGVPASCLFPMDLRHTYIFSLTTGACLDCVVESPQHPRVRALLQAPSSSDAAADLFAVRLIPANHCPGAVMFLFVSAAFGTVLHTGDFRFNGSREAWQRAMQSRRTRCTLVSPLLLSQQQQQQPPEGRGEVPVPFYEQFIADDPTLQEVAQQQLLDVLFLDNTFCAPAYRFPSQWEVTQTVVDVLRSLFTRAAHRARPTSPPPPQQRRQVRCAVLVGTYTIGKERVGLALQEAFPSAKPAAAGTAAPWPIHVSPARYELLATMGFFADCFAPMRAAAVARVRVGDDAAAASLRLAEVEDTPVLLPVAHGVPSWCGADASRGRDDSQDSAGDGGEVPVTRSASSPVVRRSLAADFDARESDGGDDGPLDRDVEYLLSVFLVSMSSVGYRTVAALASGSGPGAVAVGDGDLAVNLAPYDQVLVVEPTGWCKRCTRRDVTERHTLLRVPYSEHCGFHEMLQFVQFVNPARVVPTVSEESFRCHEALFVERAPRLRSRVSNVQPITRFFPVLPPSKTDAPPQGTCTDGHVDRPPVSSALPDVNPELLSRAQCAAQHDAPPLAGAAPEASLKRARGATASAAQTATPAAGAAAACTLQSLFQKVKLEAPSGVPRQPLADEADGGDDDDCQVVRVVQAVVEISDDD